MYLCIYVSIYRSIHVCMYVCVNECVCVCVCVPGCVSITDTESFIWSDLVCCCVWFCLFSPFVVMSCEVMCCVGLYFLAMPSCSLVLSGSILSGSVWSGLFWFWIACSVLVCLALLCLIQYCFVLFDIVLPCQLWSPLACSSCLVLHREHWSGLICSGQVRSGLVWLCQSVLSPLLWPGLVWSVLSRVFLLCCFCVIQACCVLFEYFASWSPPPSRFLSLSLSIIYTVCLHRSLSLL